MGGIVYSALGALGVPTEWQENAQVGGGGGPLARILGRHFPAALFICLLPFPFPPPSYCDLPLERATDPFSCRAHSWADPHSPPSPSISSVKKVMLAHWGTCYCLLCCYSCGPIHPLEGTQMGLADVLVCCAEALISGYGYPIRWKLKKREKRDNSRCHDADVTLHFLFWWSLHWPSQPESLGC